MFWVTQPLKIPVSVTTQASSAGWLTSSGPAAGLSVGGSLREVFVDEESVVTFGPVPAIQPSMPVQIVMHHNQRSIHSLAATMPGGEIVEFEVTSFRP